MSRIRKPLLAAALFASVAGVGLAPALAQTTPQTAPSAAAQSGEHHHRGAERLSPSDRVRGRIAYLKAELQITGDQEAAWSKVADAMRANAKALDHAIGAARQAKRPMTAVDRLALKGDFAKLRAAGSERFLAAFKPLYQQLTPAQQKTADALFAPHHGWGRHHV
jgi:hypothetical protein